MKRTFKKVISVFLVVAMLLCTAPLNGFVSIELPSLFDFKAEAATYSGTFGDDLTWTLNTEIGELIVNGTGAMPNWESSAYIPWDNYRSLIKSATISDGVTSIGSWAFYGCQNLASVKISDTVTKIWGFVFENCNSLADLTIGNNVKSFGTGDFQSCTNLNNVYYTGDLASWCGIEFSNSNPMRYAKNLYIKGAMLEGDINIPDGVTVIPAYAFKNCDGITSVTIPDSVTNIGREAFSGCDSLESITMGKNVASVGNFVFLDCNKLSNVYYTGDLFGWCMIEFFTTGSASNPMIYADNLYINGYLLEGDIVIPNGVKSITSYAFKNCDGITSVTIPDSVTNIGSNAFNECNNLERVTIPDSVTSIGSNAFPDCTQIVCNKDSEAHNYSLDNDFAYWVLNDESQPKTYSGKVGSNLMWSIDRETRTLTIDNSGDMVSFSSENSPWFQYRKYILYAQISNGCTNISDKTFYGCTYLKFVEIPYGVKSIDDEAFRGCESLASITIPDSVTSIGEWSFYYCISLANVTIPENVISIGDFAFRECNNLVSVTILDNVTSIGSYAFSSCDNLLSITIPDSVSTISASAFRECTALTDVYYGSTETDWNKISIGSNNDCLINATIHFTESEEPIIASGECGENLTWTLYESGLLEISGTGKMTDYWTINEVSAAPWISYSSKINSVIISEGVTNIGHYAFRGCNQLVNLKIADTVNDIGAEAFYNCSELKDISISDSVTHIGQSAFYNTRYYLDNTNWANEVLYIDNHLIKSKETISGEYDIKENVMTIADYAFENCTELTSITISDKTKTIGYSAFYGCANLTKVSIPNSVLNLRSSAFKNCTNLIETQLPYSISLIESDVFYGCSKLTNIIIPDSVTEIGSYAFYGCSGLTSITIPDSVTLIGDGAFYNCENLASITIPDSVIYIGRYAFDNTHYYLNDSNWDNGVLYIDKHLIKSKENIFGTYYIRDDTLTIANMAFYLCAELDRIIISNNVKSIGVGAFCGCTGIVDVNIPKSVMSVGESAFYSCVNLGCISILNPVTIIDKYAFDYCEALTSVYFGGTEEEWNAIGYSNWRKTPTIYLNHSEHTLSEWEIDVDATCFSKGLCIKKCTVCGVVLESEAIPIKATHEYIEEITTPATCTTAGVKTFTCACGDSYTETIKATGHSLKQVKIEATCLEDGKSCYQCQNCFVEFGATVIPSKGHSHEGKIITVPTCSAEGLAEYTCACGDSYSVKIPVVNHDPERYFTAPSSTEPGFDYYICNFCGNMIGDMVFLPATGFEPTNGMIVDYANNIVYGLAAGVDSLDSYTNVVADGYEWSYTLGQFGGFGTGTKATLKNSDETVAEYIVLIYGDLNGDGWYDGEDAFLVNLIAKGMLDKDDVGSAIWTAADCNHDGEINETDVDLLMGAGLKLNDVDQTKPVEELATNSDYIEYVMLIDQSAGLDVEPDTDETEQGTTTPDKNETVEPNEPATENGIDIEVIFTNIFELFKKIFTLVFSFIIK